MGNAITFPVTDVCPGCKDFVTGHAITYCTFLGEGVPEGQSLVWAFAAGVHLHDVTVMRQGQERLVPTVQREVIRVARRTRWRLLHAYAGIERACCARIERLAATPPTGDGEAQR